MKYFLSFIFFFASNTPLAFSSNGVTSICGKVDNYQFDKVFLQKKMKHQYKFINAIELVFNDGELESELPLEEAKLQVITTAGSFWTWYLWMRSGRAWKEDTSLCISKDIDGFSYANSVEEALGILLSKPLPL